VKSSTLQLLCFFSLACLLATSLASAQIRPRAPGQQQARQAQAEMEKNIPPPLVLHSTADPARLRQEADELAKAAQSVPLDIQNIEKGVFPKDMIQKLKRIEKLSKHLRTELAP
jgi:hypothetical protein